MTVENDNYILNLLKNITSSG